MKRKLAIFGLCFAGAELFAANMPPLVLRRHFCYCFYF